MKLPPEQIVPGVTYTGDSWTFTVASAPGKRPWRVDAAAHNGQGECDCPNYQKGGNRDCKHLKQLRKYLVVRMILHNQK